MSTENRNNPDTVERNRQDKREDNDKLNERYNEGGTETGMNKDSDNKKITGDENQSNIESPKS